MKSIAWVLEWASGEFLLTRYRCANGGTVVFVRSALIALLFFSLLLVLLNAMDPARSGPPSLLEFQRQLIQYGAWIGPLFGSAYAALYARFSSQWSYLAGVYNQLKAAQAKDGSDSNAIAEWRAGFVEDCDDLHLLEKEMFASIVHGLIVGDAPHVTTVCAAFDQYTPGGQARREQIAKRVTQVFDRIKARYPMMNPSVAANGTATEIS